MKTKAWILWSCKVLKSKQNRSTGRHAAMLLCRSHGGRCNRTGQYGKLADLFRHTKHTVPYKIPPHEKTA